MRRLLAIWIVLGLASTAYGWPSLSAPQTPHPAVVRVIAQDKDGFSMGSGALVAIDANHGLVLTNWHVVRDCVGPITVVFPDGFRAGARVLRTDRDWDLAALAIWRPNVQPIPLAAQPPRPGEVLTIAGYGSDSYRAASGPCTQYLSPGGNLPNELVELEASARLGDSGGPILNSQGELAGILFGTGGGRTMGSYCGRVRNFLMSVGGDFQRLPDNPSMLAQSPPPYYPPRVAAMSTQPAQAAAQAAGNVHPVSPPYVSVQQPPPDALSQTAHSAAMTQQSPSAAVSSTPQPSAEPQPALPSRLDQIKTILAAIGIIALVFHGIRLVGAAAG